MRALEVSGCAVQGCDGPVAGVLELQAVAAGAGPVRMVDVPVCEAHGRELEANREHPGALYYNQNREARRAVVVTPSAARGRWPTYQELVTRLARGEAPR